MIRGWTLLACYAGLCALFAFAVRRQWRRALGPRADAIDAVELDEHELAMLNGGPDLAITSAAAKLRPNLVALPGRPPRTFIASGRLDPHAPELEHELLGAVRRTHGISAPDLLRELADCEPVRRIVARLTEAGLLQDGSAVSRLRRLGVAGAALVMLGLGVVLAAIADREPNAVALAAVTTTTVAITTTWLASARARASARGRALLERSREQRAELRGSTDRAELGLAVALFGGAALWAADADFASAWGASTEPRMWWSGGGYGYGDDCGVGCGGCGGCG